MITIIKIWLTEDAVWIRTSDGQEASEKFEDYPRLRHATKAQRTNYQADEYGIHWPDLDEDLSFEGFLTPRPLPAAWEYHKAFLPNTYAE